MHDSSTDCMESGWVLVGVKGPGTAIKLINLTLNNRRDEVSLVTQPPIRTRKGV